jgi:uncharacterized membrane protein YdbT with pleckstrin-like domain
VSEEQVWEGGPSQWINLGPYVVCVLLCWLIVPVGIGISLWLRTRCTRYALTTERLRISTGVFTRTVEEIELYRVRDTSLVEPLLYRLFGLATILITTSDYSAPHVRLVGVPDGEAVREALRRHVEASRQRQGVRDIEMTDIHRH